MKKHFQVGEICIVTSGAYVGSIVKIIDDRPKSDYTDYTLLQPYRLGEYCKLHEGKQGNCYTYRLEPHTNRNGANS